MTAPDPAPLLTEDDLWDPDRIAAVAARLDLRQPNREALESIVLESARHFLIDRQPPPFEAVVDLATGVGKTYVLAAAVEYFAAEGVSNFAVITPGRTILDKTVANFTPGHPKSLLAGMEVRPVVVTSDNFATAAMRAAMDDPNRVKLYVFTVQSLLKPETKAGRKTHKFQEGLGQAFYQHLQGLTDLVVFADEHHTYYGKAFSDAVRSLNPRLLIGLTATPHRSTPEDSVIYRYPLAAAIADRLVKTPVIVGRKDDRSDPETKLLDGIQLIELKEQIIARWVQTSGATPVTPVMLVIAPTIAEADEIERIVASPSFAGGRYADKVLTVHSNAPDESLAALDRLEEPDNRFRIVVSVGMLKEGWDVKNVYVIASLRASVSEILTEQTLGRGLRLPFGAYTGIELLDTLEVLGHERYQDLLKKANVLNQQFIDRRSRAVLRQNAAGQLVPVVETSTVQVEVIPDGGEPARRVANGSGTYDPSPPTATIASVEVVAALGQAQVVTLSSELLPRQDAPPLRIPRLTMTTITSEFSLADITDRRPFRELGQRIAADPAGNLQRVTVDARIVTGRDGLRRTELVTRTAADRVASSMPLLPLDDARQALIERLMTAPIVPTRKKELHPAAEIVDAFLAGLGPQAETVLSGYLERSAAGLVQLVTDEHRKFTSKPRFTEVVDLVVFDKRRLAKPNPSEDRFGGYTKGTPLAGYRKSLYAQDWFDSSTERDAANVLEDEDQITLWVRLQIGDLPILWTGAKNYNPDFVAIDTAGIHWLIEVKMDKEMESDDVQGKQDAARRWSQHVSADEMTGATWRYLLLSETHVRTARGSWSALKALGG